MKITACILTLSIFLTFTGLYTVFASDSAQNYISAAVAQPLGSYQVGTSPDFVEISDLGWRPGSSAAAVTISRGSNAHGSDRTLVFDSEKAEGQGPYNATPLYSLYTDITIDAGTDTLMMYIKTPEIGTESPDPWPPRDWSVSFNAIQLRQDFTGQSDLRAHGYNSGFQGWTMKYLSIDDTEWKSFTTDANGRLFLPNGFEGYLKINMSECPLFSSWTAGGLNPSENYKVDYLEFVFGWVGGEYGSFDIGAFYTLIDDNDSVMLKLDTDLAPVAMGSTAASMEAVTVSDVSANEIGAAVDDEIVSITDLGWRPGTTKAVASVGEAVTPISQNKSIVISAEDAEGESPKVRDRITPLRLSSLMFGPVSIMNAMSS